MEQLKIEDVLKTQGMYVATTAGYSMFPMLRDRKDTIVVVPAEKRLKKYDVALYKVEDRYILHRVIKVCNDSYIIRGDNCEHKEYGIKDEDILGVLVSFYRNNNEVNMNGLLYKIYVFIWCHTCFLRRVYKKLRKMIKMVYRKIKKKGAE